MRADGLVGADGGPNGECDGTNWVAFCCERVRLGLALFERFESAVIYVVSFVHQRRADGACGGGGFGETTARAKGLESGRIHVL